MRRRPARLAFAAMVLVVVAGCAPPAPPTPSAAPPTVVVRPTPSPTPTPASTAPAASGSGVVRDDSLIGVLPAEIDGTPVTIEDASFAEAATDPAFASNIARAAFAIVTSGSDLASGVVAEPRAGAFSDAFFGSWRDTYNEGACAQAGGVATNAETSIGGRTVYITTCGGGLTVYHAWVEERAVIVSLFSLGARRYGERLMRGIRP